MIIKKCCGRKPIHYKRDPHLFCCRCNRAFDVTTGEQIENFAWMKRGDNFVLRCSACGKNEAIQREWEGHSAGQQCDECYAINVKNYKSREEVK